MAKEKTDRRIAAAVLQNHSGFRWALRLLTVGAALLGSARSPAQVLHTGRVVAVDSAFRRLVPPGARLEIIASGLQNAEGPVWVPDSAMLLFSDTKTRRVYRWKAGAGVSRFLEHAGYSGRLPYGDEPGTNGLALDGRGNILLCNHGDRRISRYPLDGRHGQETVADRYAGKRFNSPNDLALAPDGTLWFTDPPYGLPSDSLREQPVCGVYRMAPGGTPELMIADLPLPNGLAFAPGGRVLYVSVSDSLYPRIVRYEVPASGKPGAGRIFFDARSLPRTQPGEATDGLTTDRAGNVWATAPGGLVVLSPEGRLLGRVGSGEPFRNCAWGADGWLYIAAKSFVYRLKTGAPQ